MKVVLTVIRGPGKGHVMEFHEPRGFILGRGKDADFRLSPDDPYISRRHAFLEISPPSCRFRDFGSPNPPHVNGEPVEECELKDGDILELGFTQFKISITAPSSPRIDNCNSCGQPIELLSEETLPRLCLACIGRAQWDYPTVPSVWPANCSSCGSNLSGVANADGRAEELSDVAVYSCEAHLPLEEKLSGQVIGQYEFRKLLGEGGMGAVYLVYHRPTARVLALKKMKDLENGQLVKRFEREIRLLKNVKHRNIIRCIDTGIGSGGAPYLVIEYVPGYDLESHILNSGNKLSEHFATQIIFEMLDALEYLHSRSIIHRDIKPQNILLRPTIRTGTTLFSPKLADFGLAVSYARAGGTRLTNPGTGMGTLMYIPPEQVRDAGQVREPADLYSLGVTLYYMLTKQYTFDFPTQAEILEFQKKNLGQFRTPQEALRALMQLRRINHPFEIILSDEPVPIRQRNPSVSSRLTEVVDRAVRKEEAERYQSAPEFREALQRAVK